VEKQRLTTLINQPENLDEKDFRELLDMKKEYPYFQAISPLLTLGSKKYNPKKEKQHLQSAAIYALDRKHLKNILSNGFEANHDQTVVEDSKRPHTPSVEASKEASENSSQLDQKLESIQNTPPHLPDSFFEDLYKEIEALKAEKENYQKTLERFETKKVEDSKPKTKSTRKTTSKTTSKKTATTKKPTAKKIVAKPKTSTGKTTTPTKAKSAAKKTPKSKPSDKKSSSSGSEITTKAAKKRPKKDEHDIIEEITSRKELKIVDAHKKEQLNIINNFIEKEPILTKRIDADKQSNKQAAEDLSASSTNLSDDVVSETLAKLMIKQGRKQKAIDIYKKLIWKFPQKKTYFVEIIGELKKE